jgi:hypothetical protein
MMMSYAGLTRVPIDLWKNLQKKMDCRVKPGNDGCGIQAAWADAGHIS